MINLAVLGSLATKVHAELCSYFYLLLPVFFALAIIMAWFRNPAGGPEFIESLKRVIIATLLLTAFREITDTILMIANSIADKISSMNGLDNYMKMVSEKAESYPLNIGAVVLAADDFIVSIMTYLSFLVVQLARYVMMSVYHFTWIFLIIVSPILLLFHVFSSKMTLNLFKSLIEVASWKIVWAVLSAMLASLPFGDMNAAADSYITLMLMNFVIAIALILTPLMVRALVSGSFSAMTGTLGPLAAAGIVSTSARTLAINTFVRSALDARAKARRGVTLKKRPEGLAQFTVKTSHNKSPTVAKPAMAGPNQSTNNKEKESD